MSREPVNDNTLQAYLDEHRQVLIGYFSVGRWLATDLNVPRVPLEDALIDEQHEKLADILRETMPVESMIVDLWNWDVHFEEEMDRSWLYDAAFGPTSWIERCAEELSDFFVEICDEYGIDYDQQADEEAFVELVAVEAQKFIVEWRKRIAFHASGENRST